MDESNLIPQSLHEKYGLGKPKEIVLYRFQPIESYSKADLIAIIGMEHESQESEMAELPRRTDFLLGF